MVITRQIKPGRPFTTADGSRYEPGRGERFLVNADHSLPGDMVVQGDTVVLRLNGGAKTDTRSRQWRIKKAAGNPSLQPDSKDPFVARFLADGYGENVIEFSGMVCGKQVVCESIVKVHFSTANMLVSGEAVALPPEADAKFVRSPTLPVRDHREQVTARNPRTGRLVTLWQVKFGAGDDSPMGVATMTSDDCGLTWGNKQYLYRQDGDNSGWGTLGWHAHANGSRGEFLLWTCSHVRSERNRLMLFRSRDNGETWQWVGDFQQPIAAALGRPDARLIYFGVNRMIATRHGTLLAPLVVSHRASVLRSADDGRSWQVANFSGTDSRGDEDALVETLDGGKVILMARPASNGHNHQYVSTNDGRSWASLPDTTLPTARVNFGLDKIVDPDLPENGCVIYSAAATRRGLHQGRQRLVVAMNEDVKRLAEDHWDVRLLWDATCHYSDILYLPEDKSILVTVETINPGVSDHNYAAIRSFKMSIPYWRSLPSYREQALPVTDGKKKADR